jgi:hypothetical protein
MDLFDGFIGIKKAVLENNDRDYSAKNSGICKVKDRGGIIGAAPKWDPKR